MGGAAFPTKTSTPPAPTTTWFAAIPDRLTMAWGGRGAFNSNAQGVPAFLANQWNLSDATLGGFITAPDGTTNTMQLIVEDTTASANHGVSAGMAIRYPDNNSSTVNRLRISGFFKAGTRTRVALYIPTGGNGGQNGVAYTVFDLAGGQIGVGPTVTGNVAAGASIVHTYGAEIVSFGNGVYRCSMDFNFTFVGGGSFLAFAAYADAGSGTGAANFTYTGDGVSGFYAWKMSVMPAAAWGINSTPMFDDFTSLSTIDTNNTGAPGFKWYIDVSWPGFTTGQPPDNLKPFVSQSTFTVNNSVLTIGPAGILGGLEYSMASAQSAYPAPSGYVGTGWTLPLLFEIKMAYNVYQSPGPNIFSPGAAIYWTLPLEFLSTAALNPRPPGGNISREVDMAEFLGVQGTFQATQHYFQPAPTPSVVADEQTLPSGTANDGISLWSQYITYTTTPATSVVDPFDSNRYTAITGANLGNPPHSNPGNWSLGGLPGTPPGSFDASQFHTYSTLILPLYNSTPLGPNGTDYIGSIYHFYDGGCINPGIVTPFTQFIVQPPVFSSYVGNYVQTTDGFHFIFIIGTDQNLPLQIDFARVMQP